MSFYYFFFVSLLFFSALGNHWAFQIDFKFSCPVCRSFISNRLSECKIVIHILEFELLLGDFGVFDVDGLGRIVERGSLQDDDGHTGHASHKEQPQEEAVEYHGHKLPIFNHLKKIQTNQNQIPVHPAFNIGHTQKKFRKQNKTKKHFHFIWRSNR